jgi:hypothetical protein
VFLQIILHDAFLYLLLCYICTYILYYDEKYCSKVMGNFYIPSPFYMSFLKIHKILYNVYFTDFRPVFLSDPLGFQILIVTNFITMSIFPETLNISVACHHLTTRCMTPYHNSVAGFSLRSSWFDSRIVCEICGEKMAIRQVSLRLLRLSPVIIIPWIFDVDQVLRPWDRQQLQY